MKRFFAWVSILFLGLGTVWAHKPSDGYLNLTVSNRVVYGQLELAIRDLDYRFAIDVDHDGRVTWAELKSKYPDFETYIRSKLLLSTSMEKLSLSDIRHQIIDHLDGRYAVFLFRATTSETPQLLTVDYHLLFEADMGHRGLVNVCFSPHARSDTVVCSPDDPLRIFKNEVVSPWIKTREFLGEGVWHIWKGFDHVLFLLSLLIPAVLHPSARTNFFSPPSWVPVATIRVAALHVIKLVTAFTCAHSITLALAVFRWVELPSRWVESLIAFSVVVAAVNNIRPFFRHRTWIVAFGFGLIHGFGFAGVLNELGLKAQALLPSLIGFNLGVELGQLVIVSIFLPFAFMLRKSLFYQIAVVRFGSCLILLVASSWLLDRSFALNWMPF